MEGSDSEASNTEEVKQDNKVPGYRFKRSVVVRDLCGLQWL